MCVTFEKQNETFCARYVFETDAHVLILSAHLAAASILRQWPTRSLSFWMKCHDWWRCNFISYETDHAKPQNTLEQPAGAAALDMTSISRNVSVNCRTTTVTSTYDHVHLHKQAKKLNSRFRQWGTLEMSRRRTDGAGMESGRWTWLRCWMYTVPVLFCE